MAEPSVLTSIATATTPVLISGDESQPLSWVSFDHPGEVVDVVYAPTSPWLEGSTAVSATLQQTAMGGTLRAEGATEAELRANVDRLRAAIKPLVFTTTLTINGQSDTWSCNRGSLAPVARDYEDLRRFVAFYTLTIPCFPIPGA